MFKINFYFISDKLANSIFKCSHSSKCLFVLLGYFLSLFIGFYNPQSSSAQNEQAEDQIPALPSARNKLLEQDNNRTIFLVPPIWTDPRITVGDGDNVVFFNNPISPNATLLIYIGVAINFAREEGLHFVLSKQIKKEFAYPFLDTAANLGYRVICLDYAYQPPPSVVCRGKKVPNPECHECLRERKVFGTNVKSEDVMMPAEACILNRIDKLLKYLCVHYPDQGWNNYILNGEPNWDLIALSGHSQGSGMAGYLAKKVRVAKVILFAGPRDRISDNPSVLSKWLTWHSATPPERWYEIYHAKDSEAIWNKRCSAALGVSANHTFVLTAEPRRPPGIQGDIYHYSVLNPRITPLNPDGSYVLQPIWDFVLK